MNTRIETSATAATTGKGLMSGLNRPFGSRHGHPVRPAFVMKYATGTLPLDHRVAVRNA